MSTERLASPASEGNASPSFGGRIIRLGARGPTEAEESSPETRVQQLEALRERVLPLLEVALPEAERLRLNRREIAAVIGTLISEEAGPGLAQLTPLEHRDLVTALLNALMAELSPPEPERRQQPASAAPAAMPVPSEAAPKRRVVDVNWASVEGAKATIQQLVVERMDVGAAAALPRAEFERRLSGWVMDLLAETRIQLNLAEQRELVAALLADMLGLGPLEPLLGDDSVTDIMVNGPRQVYVERRGKLELTDIRFRDDSHVMAIITRIVTAVGRRIDESVPLVDARLGDGSRVNVIIPPLAIDGPAISIRKFSRKSITLDVMAKQGNMSQAMATVLKIAARCRLNILISGGTGSGKTTLLNALSRMIDMQERLVTIEDAAELQLQQPHVVRLETRPANLEGSGEITMRDLLKNALRMRPDRIILGEIRGAEALDVLQAMNTGHDGSMSTIHANRPREALTRLENMVGMTGINLPARAVRTQIAGAVHLVIQISRMRDGVRRVVNVTEIVGMEGDVVTTQDLFNWEYLGEGTDGKLHGRFNSGGVRPHFMPRAEYYGLERALLEAV